MSRKANRKSGEPPGRRQTGEAETPLPWAFVLGIFLAFVSLCLVHATLREIYIGLHRDDYVRDELVVSSLSSPDDDVTLHGQIASSGETVNVPMKVAGLDRLDLFRQLQREGRIKGQRVPVWYLPQETPWWLSGNNQVRVLDVWQSDDRFDGWRIAVAITAPLTVVTVLLLLYGLKQLRVRQGAAATASDRG